MKKKYKGADPNRFTRAQKIKAAKSFRELGINSWMKDFKQATYSTELMKTVFGKR